MTLAADERVHWLLGGSGSGKTTVCRELGERYGITVIDMDARIYGSYHARFSASRHPVSHAWSTAEDGLAWQLAMTWPEFDAFNRASTLEYLDLLAEDLAAIDDTRPIVIDGGIATPALLATVLAPSRIAAVRRTDIETATLWTQPGPRVQMRDAVLALDATGEMWRRFLEFDANITQTIAEECAQAGIAVCAWAEPETPAEVAGRVAGMWGLGHTG